MKNDSVDAKFSKNSQNYSYENTFFSFINQNNFIYASIKIQIIIYLFTNMKDYRKCDDRLQYVFVDVKINCT